MINSFIPSIGVTLYLTADNVDPDEITRRLGIIPTSTRMRDEFPPQSIAAGVARNLWRIEVREDDCIALSIVSDKLLAIFDGKLEILKTICNDYNLKVSIEVVIHMKDGDSPEVVLHGDIISLAASINAEIGFDIYCYE